MALGENATQPVAASRRPRQSASEDVASRVIDLIRDQRLQPGDRLPTVEAMARSFGVAQPTMRESLRLLQAVNMVEIRHGSGIYLKQLTAALVLPNPYPGRLTPSVLLDLFEARLLIEPHLAGLASRHASEEDLAALADVLEQASQHLTGEDALLGCLNMNFHRAVARISGSTLLSQIMDSLVDLYHDEQLVVMRLYDDRHRDHDVHLGIMSAIAGRDATLSKQRMRSHLRMVRDVVARRLAAEPVLTTVPPGAGAVPFTGEEVSRTD